MQRMDVETTRDEGDGSLYDRFAQPIFIYLCQQVSHEQDAEDLLIEVFLAAFNNEALIGLPASRQAAWLFRVARNKVIDRSRHSAILSQVSLELARDIEDGSPTPEHYAEQQESYERLYRALEHLSPLQRKLIWLRYTKGLRFIEIAAILGKSEEAVRQLYTRTLHHLRGMYQQAEKGEQR